jgi:hypothetical protein
MAVQLYVLPCLHTLRLVRARRQLCAYTRAFLRSVLTRNTHRRACALLGVPARIQGCTCEQARGYL